MRYFLDGKEISAEDAEKVKRENQKYIDSGDFELMMKCKFIVEMK